MLKFLLFLIHSIIKSEHSHSNWKYECIPQSVQQAAPDSPIEDNITYSRYKP